MNAPLHKVLLIVAFFLLGVLGAFAAFFFPSKDDIVGVAASAKSTAVPKLESSEFSQIRDSWIKPPEWKTSKQSNGTDHPLFVGRELLYFYNTKDIKVVTGDVQIDGKYPLRWLQEYKIDYAKPGWKLEDPDGDGFSNDLEFNDKTSPRDAQSHAPILSRLRLNKYIFKPFRMRFQAVNQLDGKEVYQINLLDVTTKKSRYVRQGDDLEGFKVGEFRKKIVTKKNLNTGVDETKDESELDLYNEKIDYKVTLILNANIDSRDSMAEFVMLLPGEVETPFQVKRGAEKEIRGTKYLLKDVTEEGAVLKNTVTSELVAVPKIKDGEIAEVPPRASTGAVQ